MIWELKSYQGVVCLRCNEPIAVSQKVVDLQGKIGETDASVPYTFTARCKSCEYENVYIVQDVRAIDGEPKRRASKAKRAGA